MAGRIGGRPSPPATKTMSTPSQRCTGQPAPKGPRTPTQSPGRSRARASVTLPTRRTVWISRPPSAGSPLMEMADSPMPNGESMLNCPGSKANPPGASRTMVNVS